MDEWIQLLPSAIRRAVMGMPQQQAAELEELRIRAERPLEAVAGGKPLFLASDGRTVADPRSGLLVSRSDCLRMTEALTRHSVYTHEEQLRRGYVTMPGGHRVGVAGRAVVEKGAIRLMRDLGGFNVRIARERPGVAAGSLGKLLRPERPWLHHTLIVSPPQTGKTTFLRDLARLISYGWWPKRAVGNAVHPPYGLKVGIVDERSEIAACRDGVPTFDVGPRTDVLDACPKAEGMMMMIRSMSPDVLIADEIGRPEDAAAVEEAAHAGVAVIASAHGANLMDAARRPALRRLLEQGVFERFVLLSRSAGAPLQAAVLDRHGSRALPAATIDSGAGGTP